MDVYRPSPWKIPRRKGIQADLYAAFRVDSTSGVPTDVAVTWLGTEPRATDSVKEAIKSSVKNFLKYAKFETQEGMAHRVCMPYQFRVSRQ